MRHKEQGDKKAARVVEIILKVEKRRFKYEKINKYVGKERSGLNCLIVPPYMNVDLSYESKEFLVNKEEIEEILITRNYRHLHQAYESNIV